MQFEGEKWGTIVWDFSLEFIFSLFLGKEVYKKIYNRLLV